MPPRGWWCPLLFLLMEGLHMVPVLVRGEESSRGYAPMMTPGQKVDAPHTLATVVSRLVCAMLCLRKPGCWSFTWDDDNKECGLLNPLTSPITTTAASPNLESYYVFQTQGKDVAITPEMMGWTSCSPACQALGGNFLLPEDTTYGLILNHVFGLENFHIGCYRHLSNTAIWYDMDGQVMTKHPDWRPGQPNNLGGAQIYCSLLNGRMNDNDLHVAYTYHCLCEI